MGTFSILDSYYLYTFFSRKSNDSSFMFYSNGVRLMTMPMSATTGRKIVSYRSPFFDFPKAYLCAYILRSTANDPNMLGDSILEVSHFGHLPCTLITHFTAILTANSSCSLTVFWRRCC